MKNVVFLQENSYFNEINVFQRRQKEDEEIFKKTCQNASKNLYKFIQKSASEKNAKMMPKCSKMVAESGHEINKMV